MKKLNQWIDRFAYSHPRFGIPNLMLYIVIANAVTYILTLFAGAAALSFLEFDLYHVLHGEVWRLVTFVLLPFTYRPISLFIMLSFCYFVGGTLEREWGTAKFTLYYFSGVVLTLVVGIVTALVSGHNVLIEGTSYVNLSMFFAFAMLYPETQFLVFFIIPVKVKWLAWIDAAFFALSVVTSLFRLDILNALLPVVALLNFFVFFLS